MAPIGERNGMARITESTALNILKDAIGHNGSQSQIAARYGVCQQSVSDIARGKRWKHLSKHYGETPGIGLTLVKDLATNRAGELVSI